MKKRVVIAGFGDTGVLVAAHLKDTYDIIGVSTKPALVSGQELGARLTKLEAWKDNYYVDFERFKSLDSVHIVHGKVLSIALDGSTVCVATQAGEEITLTYDVLVIASGTRNGFWRTDVVQTTDDVMRDLERHSSILETAPGLSIVGAGPTGVSAASNCKARFPDKDVDLFYPSDHILRGYAPKTREFVTQRLKEQGVNLRPGHRVNMPKARPFPVLKPGRLKFLSGQEPVEAASILWAVGDTLPNNGFIPKALLDVEGYVQVNTHLQSKIHPNIFAIGDIAASDPHRSSARNAGFQIVATNIDRYLSGRGDKLKSFRAPKHRWGSVIGIQDEGLRIFTPKGGNVKVGPWSVKNILFPVFVHRLIYKGIRKRG